MMLIAYLSAKGKTVAFGLDTLAVLAAGDLFSASVSSAGNVVKDGYHDVIAGAHNNEGGGYQAGRAEVYVYFCCDANAYDKINVSDAVYIITYGFAGGDPPDPSDAGDANCDGTCNIADAVWIINYIFAGGYEPCNTDGDEVPDC